MGPTVGALVRPHLDDFGHTVGEFAHVQSLQESEVDKDEARLPERANHVLSVTSVNGGLSANG